MRWKVSYYGECCVTAETQPEAVQEALDVSGFYVHASAQRVCQVTGCDRVSAHYVLPNGEDADLCKGHRAAEDVGY